MKSCFRACESTKFKKVIAQALTNNHNVSMMEVRRDLQLNHPEDPNILEQLLLSLGELFRLFNWSESGDVVEAGSTRMRRELKLPTKLLTIPFHCFCLLWHQNKCDPH
ncbi:unnamed protein product [Lactuca saligna]|uniref:Uncharacterized protein n=1 Tax=Lactuca saligna TaxID=75948 RepID=A0AA36EAB5_LACSI|nr:unnamed protein product [Lactuca saligna]